MNNLAQSNEFCIRHAMSAKHQRLRFLSVRITLIVALASLGIAVLPVAQEALQFDREAVAEGQLWRVVTGNLVHWTSEHLFWDLLMFVVLGALVESRSRRRFIACLLVSAVTIPLAVAFAHPAMQTYRGLSGIDTALFSLLAVELLRERTKSRDWLAVALIALLMCGLAAKLLFELSTGSTVFAEAQGAFTPVPPAHVVGAIVGLGLSAGQRRRS